MEFGQDSVTHTIPPVPLTDAIWLGNHAHKVQWAQESGMLVQCDASLKFQDTDLLLQNIENTPADLIDA